MSKTPENSRLGWPRFGEHFTNGKGELRSRRCHLAHAARSVDALVVYAQIFSSIRSYGLPAAMPKLLGQLEH
jgi:hypothetical protein